MRTRNITVAKLRREYWDRIQQGGKRFEIRTEPMRVFWNATGSALMPPHGHGRCSPNWAT